jgi:hybrid cluster-associated redox disulfide protein
MVIKKTMTMGEILSNHPKAAEVMLKAGLHCAGCPMSRMETLEQGAKGHGMNDKAIKELIKNMEDVEN